MFQPEISRLKMVKEQIEQRGIDDVRLLEVLKRIPREQFLEDRFRRYAYDDRALPIPEGQTISQPYIVAAMVDALELKPQDRVLEVGTGSGYAAAVLAELADRVFTIERHQRLAESAEKRLRQLGYSNIEVKHGDGTLGWEEKAPFDAISVAAGGSDIPIALKRQLRTGGRLVIPIGDRDLQRLLLVTRTGPNEYEEESLGKVRFVPLVAD
jgi:protein-L-isoaspartate(D-aspartate) O-methyltransferase